MTPHMLASDMLALTFKIFLVHGSTCPVVYDYVRILKLGRAGLGKQEVGIW